MNNSIKLTKTQIPPQISEVASGSNTQIPHTVHVLTHALGQIRSKIMKNICMDKNGEPFVFIALPSLALTCQLDDNFDMQFIGAC